MPRRNLHFHDLPSFILGDDKPTEEFKQFMEAVVLPLITLTGYKREEKARIATTAVQALIKTGLIDACVSDSRRTDEPGARLRIQVWDSIIAAGLAKLSLGSESSGVQSRYRATTRLLRLRELWELSLLENLHLARNTETEPPTDRALVYLHTGRINPQTGELLRDDLQKQPVAFEKFIQQNAQPGPDGKPDPRAIERGLAYFRDLENLIDSINRNNLEHTWLATDSRGHAFQPNICLRQIHVGEFFRAVRLYSFGLLSGQNLSKEVRKAMLIDGEPAAELDFSGMFLRMAYHSAGIDPDRKQDIYRPEIIFPTFHSFQNSSQSKRAIVREFVKRATNVCWNVANRKQAHSSVGKLLTEHPEQKLLKNVVYSIEESNPTDIVARIIAAHPQIADSFFKRAGLDLMTVESRIMLQILRKFTDAKKPVLAIHDAVVCRISDVDFAKSAMKQSYRQFLHFIPVLKREF